MITKIKNMLKQLKAILIEWVVGPQIIVPQPIQEPIQPPVEKVKKAKKAKKKVTKKVTKA